MYLRLPCTPLEDVLHTTVFKNTASYIVEITVVMSSYYIPLECKITHAISGANQTNIVLVAKPFSDWLKQEGLPADAGKMR